MKNRKIIFALGCALFAMALGTFTLAPFTGCARKAGEPAMFTGKVYSPLEVGALVGGGAYYGKAQYAEVSTAWLKWAYDDFRAELSAGQFGVVSWDDRAQCTLFASAFEVYCQKRYFAQAFHSRIPAPGIAVGVRWFHPTPDTGHAINPVLTELGLVEFEPQTGKFLALTAAQRDSSYLKKFD